MIPFEQTFHLVRRHASRQLFAYVSLSVRSQFMAQIRGTVSNQVHWAVLVPVSDQAKGLDTK